MKINKLVRNRVPHLIKKNGQIPVTYIASEEEYWLKLQDKLKEEVGEFLDGGNHEELADILEVLYAICDFKNIDREELEVMRAKKVADIGNYSDRIVLDSKRFDVPKK